MKIFYSLLGIILVGLLWDANFHPIPALLNLFPVLVWFAFLLFVTNSWFFSTAAISLIVATIYFLSALKLEVWRQPITPADLHYFQSISDLWGVLRAYTQPYLLIAVAIASIALVVLIYYKKIDRKKDRFLYYTENTGGVFKRLFVAAVGVTAMALWIDQTIDFGSPLHRIYHDFSTKHGASVLKASLKENGFFTYFMAHLPLFEIRMPPFDRTMALVEPPPVPRGQGPSGKPDILVWVNESTFDPRFLKLDCPGMPSFKMFQDHPANIASGLLNVHTFGGRTWMTEFGFFAGIPPRIFGPSGTCAPYTLVPRLREALGTHLRSRGYRTVALNPVAGRFMDTASVYKRYGIDEFYDPKRLGHPDPESWHIPDAFFKEQTIRFLKGHNGPTPLFLIVLTMENHGPHGKENSPEMPCSQHPELAPKTALQLNDYLARLKNTDAAIEAITLYIMKRPRPTIFLYFGDHLPAFIDDVPDRLFDVERGVDKMKTTFHIRTNYPVEHPDIPRILDVSYLSGLLLDVAHLNDSPFFRFNAFMRHYAGGKMILQGNSDPYVNTYIARIIEQVRE